MQENFYDVKDEDRGFRNLRRRTYRLGPVYWPPQPQPNPKSDSGVTVGWSTEFDRFPDPWGFLARDLTQAGERPTIRRRPGPRTTGR